MNRNIYDTWFEDSRLKYMRNIGMNPTHCIIRPDVFNELKEDYLNGIKLICGYAHGSDVFNFFTEASK